MSRHIEAQDGAHGTGPCPNLVNVVADRLWMYPVGVYCRRQGAHVRVPARSTLARVCMTPAHVKCVGFRAGEAAV